MDNQLVPSTSLKLPNREGLAKVSGGVFKIALIGGVGLLLWSYVLPFLLATLAGTALFIVLGVIVAFLLYTVMNPKFWRGLTYLSQLVADTFLKTIIEMNPWAIMNKQLDAMEEDREAMHKQCVLLQGQQSKLTSDISDYDEVMRSSNRQVAMVQEALSETSDPEEINRLNRQLAVQSSKFTSAKSYIDGVKPTLDGINQTVHFLNNAYDQSGDVIEIYREKIKTQKALWDAVTTGSKAMASARLAFQGRPGLTKDSLQAMEFLRQDIGNKAGAMKDSMKIASGIMDGKQLADAAKVQESLETMKQFNLNDKFKYSDSVGVEIGAVPTITIQEGNKFLKLLK